MTSLKIPQLDLFHHRRSSAHEIYEKVQYSTQKAIRNYKVDKESRLRDVNIPNRQYQHLYSAPHYKPTLPTRYKEIADHYLQKRGPIPIYLQPVPYVTSLPPYSFHGSPSRAIKNSRKCQCQQEAHYRATRQKSIHKNPYITGDKYNIPLNKQHRIQKGPYLIPTFRTTNQRKSFIEKGGALSYVQKIKTHQSEQQQHQRNPQHKPTHQAQIQTEKNRNNSSIIEAVSEKIFRKSTKIDKRNIQKTLQEQKQYLENIRREYQHEDELRVNFQDLQATKDEYIEKSKEILFQLNQLAEDKKEFALISKFFVGDKKKKENVFWALEL